VSEVPPRVGNIDEDDTFDDDGEVSDHVEGVRGVRAAVAVTMPVLPLLDDDAAVSAPAELDGVGPIPIRAACALCGAADG
jgi:hypothetical protein